MKLVLTTMLQALMTLIVRRNNVICHRKFFRMELASCVHQLKFRESPDTLARNQHVAPSRLYLKKVGAKTVQHSGLVNLRLTHAPISIVELEKSSTLMEPANCALSMKYPLAN